MFVFQVLSSLEKTLKNTVLLDHMYAVIKNTKIIQKGESPKKVGEKRPKNRKQAKQVRFTKKLLIHYSFSFS